MVIPSSYVHNDDLIASESIELQCQAKSQRVECFHGVNEFESTPKLSVRGLVSVQSEERDIVSAYGHAKPEAVRFLRKCSERLDPLESAPPSCA